MLFGVALIVSMEAATVNKTTSKHSEHAIIYLTFVDLSPQGNISTRLDVVKR